MINPKLETHKAKFASEFKRLRDEGKTEALQALKDGYDCGYEEAYWDWRSTILTWAQKHSLPDEFRTYLDHLQSKPPPKE